MDPRYFGAVNRGSQIPPMRAKQTQGCRLKDVACVRNPRHWDDDHPLLDRGGAFACAFQMRHNFGND